MRYGLDGRTASIWAVRSTKGRTIYIYIYFNQPYAPCGYMSHISGISCNSHLQNQILPTVLSSIVWSYLRVKFIEDIKILQHMMFHNTQAT